MAHGDPNRQEPPACRSERGMIPQSWPHNGLQRLSRTQDCQIHKETAPVKAGAAWPGAAHPRGVLHELYQHAIALKRPCPAEAGHGSAIAAEEQNSRNRIRRSSPPKHTLHPESRGTHTRTTSPATGRLATLRHVGEGLPARQHRPGGSQPDVCQRIVRGLSLGSGLYSWLDAARSPLDSAAAQVCTLASGQAARIASGGPRNSSQLA